MCLACSMVCCASDEFEGCGCVHCDNPECWAEPNEYRDDDREDEDEDDYFDALPLAACPCAPAPARFRCDEIRELLARLNSVNAWTTCLIPEKALPILESFLRQVPATRSHMLGTAILGVPKPGAEIAGEFGGVINDSDRHEHSNWAWPLTQVERFEPPVPAKGAQGFWYWDGGPA